MQTDTIDRIHQQLLTLSSDKLQTVLNFVSSLSISPKTSPINHQSDIFPTENAPSPEQKQPSDITKTKTWSAIGKYQIPNPDCQYIVSTSDLQELTTNYAEHIDDILNPPTDLI